MADGVSRPPRMLRASDDGVRPRRIVPASEEHAARPPRRATVAVPRRRRTARSQGSPHSDRFRTVTAVLSGFGLGAVMVAIAILATDGSGGTPAKWSQWAPPDRGTLGAREIADHLAPFYRLSGVDQLAVVTVVNLDSTGAAASAAGASASSSSSGAGLQVAVRPDPSSSAVSILNGTTIGYNLCGIGGSDCAIDIGQPSAQRLLLLRREALELALYTFKYIGGVQNVVAILPPGHTMTQSTLTAKPPFGRPVPEPKPVDVALLFLHDQLSPLLSQPLSNTLPEQYPPSVAQMSGAPEAPLVDQLTAGGLFSERLEQAQDGSSLMVLDPLPPQ